MDSLQFDSILCSGILGFFIVFFVFLRNGYDFDLFGRRERNEKVFLLIWHVVYGFCYCIDELAPFIGCQVALVANESLPPVLDL